MRHTPENITRLAPNEIFVFGSNRRGTHDSIAARTAVKNFGAVKGIGSGFQGQSYAIPVLDEQMKKVSIADLETAITCLIYEAYSNAKKIFLVTRIGCGLAGFKTEEIKTLFRDVPVNVILPNWDVRV